MSGGDIIVSSAPLPSVIPDPPIDGSPVLIGGGGQLLMYVNVGIDVENDFIHLFDKAAAPVPGDTPRFAFGALKKGPQLMYFFGPTGSFFPVGLAFGMSTTLATFTAVPDPTQFHVTFGRLPTP